MESSQLQTPSRTPAHPVAMKLVVADDLPESALELLRSEPGWHVDARSGRQAADLARDLADADALLVRSATKVTAELLKDREEDKRREEKKFARFIRHPRLSKTRT